MGERRPTLGLSGALPGIVLVLVIAWALAAVLMLTATLINAREIDDVIPIINNQVSPINKDLDSVKLAAETAKISERIDRVARPLVGHTDRIIVAAKSIDQNAAAILATAQSINKNAREINGTVRSINGRVRLIGGNVVSINDTVSSIEENALAINGKADSIDSSVTSIHARVGSIFARVGPVGARDRSIKASVGRITRSFTSLRPVTRGIHSGVAGINRRARKGTIGVRSLKSDFAPISVLVGPGLLGAAGHGTEGPAAIHGHANSIDCARLLTPTQYCNK